MSSSSGHSTWVSSFPRDLTSLYISRPHNSAAHASLSDFHEPEPVRSDRRRHMTSSSASMEQCGIGAPKVLSRESVLSTALMSDKVSLVPRTVYWHLRNRSPEILEKPWGKRRLIGEPLSGSRKQRDERRDVVVPIDAISSCHWRTASSVTGSCPLVNRERARSQSSRGKSKASVWNPRRAPRCGTQCSL